jgi:endonuclease YncB( thermonuclease family)
MKVLGLGLASSLLMFLASSVNVQAADIDAVGKVQKVSDGDTIHFQVQPGAVSGGQSLPAKIKIRMVGIDTPESQFSVAGQSQPASQGPLADDATALLNSLIPVGAQVQAKLLGLDNTGKRYLGQIEVNGRDVNLEMVKQGMAYSYIICTGADCDSTFIQRRQVAEYLQACQAAVDQGLGIFSPTNGLKELPFEFRIRMRRGKPDKLVGDIQTKKFVDPSEYKQIAPCQRVFFMNEQDAANAGFTR